MWVLNECGRKALYMLCRGLATWGCLCVQTGCGVIEIIVGHWVQVVWLGTSLCHWYLARGWLQIASGDDKFHMQEVGFPNGRAKPTGKLEMLSKEAQS